MSNIPARFRHKKYGYDVRLVPKVLCFACEKPIGDEAYVHFDVFARFGDMYLYHWRCDPNRKKAKKKR